MPTFGECKRPYEIDRKLWQACEARARKAMLAAGWNAKARKFDTVHRVKAMQEWRKARRTEH